MRAWHGSPHLLRQRASPASPLAAPRRAAPERRAAPRVTRASLCLAAVSPRAGGVARRQLARSLARALGEPPAGDFFLVTARTRMPERETQQFKKKKKRRCAR